jgi:hypothetical protein
MEEKISDPNNYLHKKIKVGLKNKIEEEPVTLKKILNETRQR